MTIETLEAGKPVVNSSEDAAIQALQKELHATPEQEAAILHHHHHSISPSPAPVFEKPQTSISVSSPGHVEFTNLYQKTGR